MLSDEIAISVRGLSKSYTLAHGGIKRPSFREAVVDRIKHPLQKPQTETFWALNDVSFDVKKGEVLGIIGRNGAGKSTLLKVLSRIVEPTAGAVDLFGRVGSLLEVGTGFHPELTGRENIFLNGTILGMRRDEIRRQFDAIVDFAEVERFLDTPVKRYSSGMYVRLAFAVAAHLNPEILIVDEVLAVGDASFQKKCLGKMSEVSKNEGRTVLFVSHNIDSICALCPKCILLKSGQVVELGSTPDIVARYLGADLGNSCLAEFDEKSEDAYMRSASLLNSSGDNAMCFTVAESITIRLQSVVRNTQPDLQVAFSVLNVQGERIFYSSNVMAEDSLSIEEAGTHTITARIPARLLLPGRYYVDVALHRPNIHLYDHREHALTFEVIQADDYHGFSAGSLGYVYADVKWEKEQLS